MRRAGLIGGGIALAVVLVLASRELVERAPRERGRTAATARGADGPEDDSPQGLVAPASVTDETRDRSEPVLLICVRDETGEPVRGARVSVIDPPRSEATTDGSGRCDLALASGELELEVSAPGHVAFRDRFFGTREELELVLPRCGPVLGRVVDETSGAPIAGARVHVRRESRWHPEVADVLADAEGRFRFDCAPLTGAFRASAPGFAEGEGASDPDHEDEVTIALTPAVTIEVEVREAPDGPPIEAARVKGAVLDKLNACTDAEGRVFVAKEECDSLLEIQALDFCAVTGNLRGAQLPSSGPLVFFLWRPAYLAGVVRDASGRPVEDVRIDFEEDHGPDRWGLLPQLPGGCQYVLPRGGVVRLQDIEVRSDAAGRYRSVPLFPGSSEVRVHAVHPTGDCFTTAGPLGAAGTVTPFDLTITHVPAGTVEGHVTFNRFVTGGVAWNAPPRSGYAQLDLEQNYKLTNVPAGRVELSCNCVPGEFARLVPNRSATIAVQDGATTRHDFELSIPMAEIGGSITRTDGSPVDPLGFTVSHGDPGYRGDDKTMRSGTWSHLVPDLGWEYEVEFRWGADTLRLSGVRAGDTHVDVVLPDLALLPVRALNDEDGTPLRTWKLFWRRHGATRFIEAGGLSRGRDTEDGGETDSTVLLRIQPATIDLWVEADGGYLPVLLESLVAELGTAPRLDVRLARSLEVALEIDGDLAALAGEVLFLLEGEVWPDVRAGGGEHAQNPVWLRDGDGNLAVDAGPRLSAHELELRRISVRDGRRMSVSGLRPGPARFKSLSGHVRFEPETVTLPCPQPLRVRCTRVE